MKKSFIILCAIIAFGQRTNAQDSCYNCNLDSLSAVLKTTKDDNEKIKLLTLLSDLKLPYSPIDTVSRGYIHSLIEISKSQKVNDIEAYESLQEGLLFFEKKDFVNAQNSFKKSILLFDRTHKRIPLLLMTTRITYNEKGNQEDRFKFYSDKLQYYLVNGPVENVAACYHSIAGYYLYKADYNLAISNYLKAADIYKNYDNKAYYNVVSVVANTYSDWGNYKKALEYFNRDIPLVKIAKDSQPLTFIYNSLADMNHSQVNYSQALIYSDSALLYDTKSLPPYTAEAYLQKASALIGLNRLSEALSNLKNAQKISDSGHLKIFAAYGSLEIDYGYYQYYMALKKYDEAATFLLAAYKKSIEEKSHRLQLKYLKELSIFYGRQNNPVLAFTYTNKFYDLTDQTDRGNSVFKIAQYENEKKEIAQNESINTLKEASAIQAATIKKNNIILWGSLAALLLISTSLVFVYRQFHLNKKILLSLRKTQRQLIMSEKMASLGELTAGIAHEIQNPLNFVNNFSEVNNELIDEMQSEIKSGNTDEAINISNDIKGNQDKIIHHGKRADAIVKGMLQHSRTSSSQEEPTDINKLADEYLRLSYHGLRAKDKTFNATLQTNFDNSIEKINVIPQDIGRVLLNLYNNAFYAVTEKSKQQFESYQPTVSVNTKKINDKIEIRVKDNGSGISQKVIDKIFQPFFTTKPTGQGTGLGLSLSYDIIKAHGGEIRVETREGDFSEFIIQLPSN